MTMRLLTFILATMLLFSCSKPNTDYSGTYVGDVTINIGTTAFSTEKRTLTFSKASNSAGYVMSGNIFNGSYTVDVKNNQFTIVKTQYSSGALEVWEAGTGKFAGNSLTIDFAQGIGGVNSGDTLGTAKGTLTKQ